MIAVGVDTHKHEHLARAVDGPGQILGGLTIWAELSGYIELTQWLRTLGEDVVVGIEGAGSYGAAPRPASSGQTIRYRLSRGGDRQANNALHTTRIRARHDESTRAYLERRISEGKTPREAMRVLKRHLSRSLYKRLITVPLT